MQSLNSVKDREQSEEAKKLINESYQIDDNIHKQIKYIQEIRQQTKDAIASSASVVQCFEEAQKNYKNGVQKKRFENFGNEHFISKLTLNRNLLMDNRRNSVGNTNM